MSQRSPRTNAGFSPETERTGMVVRPREATPREALAGDEGEQ